MSLRFCWQRLGILSRLRSLPRSAKTSHLNFSISTTTNTTKDYGNGQKKVYLSIHLSIGISDHFIEEEGHNFAWKQKPCKQCCCPWSQKNSGSVLTVNLDVLVHIAMSMALPVITFHCIMHVLSVGHQQWYEYLTLSFVNSDYVCDNGTHAQTAASCWCVDFS